MNRPPVGRGTKYSKMVFKAFVSLIRQERESFIFLGNDGKFNFFSDGPIIASMGFMKPKTFLCYLSPLPATIHKMVKNSSYK